MRAKRLQVLTWHVHGSYLRYLASAPHDFVVPVKPGRPEGFGGRSGQVPWPDNVVEIEAAEVPHRDFDVILYQSHRNWLVDRQEILSEEQRCGMPQIFLEHDPPRESPTDTRHPVDDPDVLLVHVTAFNRLMWDSGTTPTTVIDHGVVDHGHRYRGALDRGLVVVNGLATRGRRLGCDVFQRVRDRVPLDLVGMGSQELDGLGEVPIDELPDFAARYRFFFNPIRYTSLGLAVCEAMMLGMPVLGLATTEMTTAVRHGVAGFVETDEDVLVEHMHRLLADPAEAARLGLGARRTALDRFHIDRFARDWDRVLRAAAGGTTAVGSPEAVPA